MTKTDTIKLDQYLKFIGVAPTGGQAKLLIQDGHVQVNGETEIRRGRQLVTGDRVTVLGRSYQVRL
ncbi:RNA-binding S4 domain-containing protein [Planktothrix sp. FACHB-1355]|uniref:RNA-binding S4 domain-containing protein n=2 Tax=Cyanophyceae TaxID=3028117 RepID=A0A926ZKF0_9CYAN|nr:MULTISPECIES: RNA-binding S4 domain-containing protein [Oscillatoriales]MBD2185302.1 RNA-binding S4 domain-containing protein [Aerosakkonema funiforme FACHB-1375]MBD3562885.1 RNA-binding S4 domain-containing protein [Planktothrix sp. FACHB-1355]